MPLFFQMVIIAQQVLLNLMKIKLSYHHLKSFYAVYVFLIGQKVENYY